MIAELALRKGYQVHRSSQPHGARLEREPRILERVKDYGASTVIVVEMPGPETEEAIRAMGKHLVVIDHHNYTDLERAHAPDGSTLPSSFAALGIRTRSRAGHRALGRGLYLGRHGGGIFARTRA